MLGVLDMNKGIHFVVGSMSAVACMPNNTDDVRRQRYTHFFLLTMRRFVGLMCN
jgi:hypothetical protein